MALEWSGWLHVQTSKVRTTRCSRRQNGRSYDVGQSIGCMVHGILVVLVLNRVLARLLMLSCNSGMTSLAQFRLDYRHLCRSSKIRWQKALNTALDRVLLVVTHYRNAERNRPGNAHRHGLSDRLASDDEKVETARPWTSSCISTLLPVYALEANKPSRIGYLPTAPLPA